MEFTQAKRYALKRLSERALYSGELSKCLKERLVASQTIEQVIQGCRELGLLNDDEWIEAFIRGHLRRRHSLRTIAWKLQAKGVPAATAKRVTQAHNDTSNDKESIQHLLTTRYRSRDLTNRRERDKVIASLMRKGFSFDAIRDVMSGSDE